MSEEKKDKPAKGSKASLNIKMTDEIAKGTYANLGIVHNNDAEFVFDFIFMEPQRRQGQVVSRIVTNPRTVKRLLLGLTELVQNFEERFGKIELPKVGSPKGTYH
jgi:hypothetical protein